MIFRTRKFIFGVEITMSLTHCNDMIIGLQKSFLDHLTFPKLWVVTPFRTHNHVYNSTQDMITNWLKMIHKFLKIRIYIWFSFSTLMQPKMFVWCDASSLKIALMFRLNFLFAIWYLTFWDKSMLLLGCVKFLVKPSFDKTKLLELRESRIKYFAFIFMDDVCPR